MRHRLPILAALGSLLVSAPGLAADPVPDQFAVWGFRAAPSPAYGLVLPPARAIPLPLQMASPGGMLVFSRTTTDAVAEDDLPRTAEALARLELRDVAGEVAGATFGVMAVANGTLNVVPTAALTGPGGTIGLEHVQVRSVTLVRELVRGVKVTAPFTLGPAVQVAVSGGRCRTFRLLVDVPGRARPGAYEGKLAVILQGRGRREVPVRLTVRELGLARADAGLSVALPSGLAPAALGAARTDVRLHGLAVAAPGAAPTVVLAGRAAAGFLAWKAGAAPAVAAYQRTDQPDLGLAWPAADRKELFVPTLRWEAVRDGAKDFAYAATLAQRAGHGSGSAYDDARALLQEIGDEVTAGTPPGALDAWRDRIAASLERLSAR